ncbi:hypothetical protein G8759_27690 [Spirosoma aureum]|uniref:Uncharacterized protein n=1 Tax=Spirosoma aureum TaxID=2692134 RepID=A0A6G9AUZ6_9BACT|nr:hypothetical protein [Spirosoma aureum]QIP16149.1 hypothetical protein G8759_27690 [Spirosoma aureum]
MRLCYLIGIISQLFTVLESVDMGNELLSVGAGKSLPVKAISRQVTKG